MILSKGDSLQDGKYIIEQKLGEGGFGVTYKAKNTYLNLIVVIKTLKEEKIKHPNNQNYLARFKREARVLADLSQQRNLNIVQVKDFFEESGIPYLVMEFLSGESLGMRVKRQGRLSESLALQYISQIGSALEVVHKANLIHRDAHPDNIMIVQNEAILIDFGIVVRIDAPYLTNEHPTHFYFAPYEQRDGSTEPTVDIYALAASLYYALTAEHPAPSFYRKSGHESLKSPTQLNPSLSRKVEAAILKGMELEAGNRPQSMQDWLKLLPSTSSTSQPDDLSSDRNVDYTRLRDLLADQNWKDADYETYLVMLQVVGRKDRDWIRADELFNFPCTDLRTIDSLWVKYSNGRFGFSVQKKIYLSVGGIPNGKYYEEAFIKFGDRVGWRKGWFVNKEWITFKEVTFDTSAPEGHLPRFWFSPFFHNRANYSQLGYGLSTYIYGLGHSSLASIMGWGILLSHPDL